MSIVSHRTATSCDAPGLEMPTADRRQKAQGAPVKGFGAIWGSTPTSRGARGDSVRPRVVAAHDAQVCDGAGGFTMGQRQRKPSPFGEFLAPTGNRHTRFLGARGQSKQHQSCYCDEYGWHPKIFTRHSPDGLIAERKLAPFRLCRQHRSAAAFALGADASACSAAVSRVQAWRTDILARFVTAPC